MSTTVSKLPRSEFEARLHNLSATTAMIGIAFAIHDDTPLSDIPAHLMDDYELSRAIDGLPKPLPQPLPQPLPLGWVELD